MNAFFKLPNEHSIGIILTDSDFILTERTCGRVTTAELRFSSALVALLRENTKKTQKKQRSPKLWKQRPRIGGVAALPSSPSQIP